MLSCVGTMVRASEFSRLAKGAELAQRMRQAGRTLSGDAIWTKREIAICRTLYPDVTAIRRRLPHRTRSAIQNMCWRLNLCQVIPDWSGAELTKLRRLFPSATWDELQLAFPQRSISSIKTMAYKHGFRRRRRPYKRTCHEALDQIRDLCTAQGLYMPDIDEFTGGGRYFERLAYRRKTPNFKAIDKAARELGGRLTIQWDEDADG